MDNIAIEVTRGPVVESTHRGSVAVADSSGKLIAYYGNPRLVTYLRSSAKPLYTTLALMDGMIDHYGFEDPQITVMSASHSGEDVHLEQARLILERIGLDEDALLCGPHLPLYEPQAHALLARGEKPRPIHNNCSGKHAGWLAQCRFHGYPIDDYLSPDHPLNRRVREQVARLAGVAPEDLQVGVDGCGLPVHATELVKMAASFAALSNLRDQEGCTGAVKERLCRAISGNGLLISGTGRLDVALMDAARGKIVCKGGAEALHCVGLVGQDIGIAVKIEDGGPRGREILSLETLRQLGALDEEQMKVLAHLHQPEVRNHGGTLCGVAKACFDLVRV